MATVKEKIVPLVPHSAFPILERSSGLAYLDSAASAQKPESVLNTWRAFYETHYANIHRGVYPLSEASSIAYDKARVRVAHFLKTPNPDSIIFTRNATEALNLVAQSWGETYIRAGDIIIVTILEHHSNFVPWQILAQKTGAEIRIVDIDPDGNLDLNHLASLMEKRVRLVACSAASNSLGTKIPVKAVTEIAHDYDALAVIDAAQAAPHMPIDVVDWDCDFLAITGHKLYGPDGIGALYGRPELLRDMPPFMSGGGMVASVSTHETLFADPPRRFEAGTPAIGEAIALAAALDFLTSLGWEKIETHEQTLTRFAINLLQEIPQVEIIGNPKDRIGILSLEVAGLHPHDVGMILGEAGICVRTGHHCTQPLMNRLNLSGTVRASFGIYNSSEDIERLVAGLLRATEILTP